MGPGLPRRVLMARSGSALERDDTGFLRTELQNAARPRFPLLLMVHCFLRVWTCRGGTCRSNCCKRSDFHSDAVCLRMASGVSEPLSPGCCCVQARTLGSLQFRVRRHAKSGVPGGQDLLSPQSCSCWSPVFVLVPPLILRVGPFLPLPRSPEVLGSSPDRSLQA